MILIYCRPHRRGQRWGGGRFRYGGKSRIGGSNPRRLRICFRWRLPVLEVRPRMPDSSEGRYARRRLRAGRVGRGVNGRYHGRRYSGRSSGRRGLLQTRSDAQTDDGIYTNLSLRYVIRLLGHMVRRGSCRERLRVQSRRSVRQSAPRPRNTLRTLRREGHRERTLSRLSRWRLLRRIQTRGIGRLSAATRTVAPPRIASRVLLLFGLCHILPNGLVEQ